MVLGWISLQKTCSISHLSFLLIALRYALYSLSLCHHWHISDGTIYQSQIMDACVVVLRESLFSHFDSSVHPRVDVLPCSFLRSLAELYTKFKKVTHKDKFLFDPTLIKSIRARFRQMGKHWVKDIDFLYFPFNIDRNRWVGVMVDLLSSTLTVFDSTANVSRATRLKPDFDFICEMLPFFIRKASLNGKMKAFPTKPLSFLEILALNRHLTAATLVFYPYSSFRHMPLVDIRNFIL